MNASDKSIPPSLKYAEQMGVLRQAIDSACEYIATINDRPVFPDNSTLSNLEVFEEPLPENPTDSKEVIQKLHSYGSPATVAQLGGRYFGFVNGGIVPVALAARWLADAWDQNAGLYVMGPPNSVIEGVCEKWLIDLLHLPEGSAVGFVSGTSTALACGFAAARDFLLARSGWDANKNGLFRAPEINVVVGEHAHSAVFKSLAFVGLGSDRLTRVPADDQGRMRLSEFPALDSRTLVVAQAGNVNSGAFDPLDEICDRASAAGAWVHVDGAFGLWGAASQSKRHLLKGYEKADSWAIDAHKSLNAPYDSGFIICRNREALISAMRASGSYIQTSDHRDPMFLTLEMGRRARAIEIWAILKALGRKGVEDLVDWQCAQARNIATRLRSEGFHIRNDVTFNQVLVSCGEAELTKATLAGIQKSGECWCGSAVWFGEPVIRVSVCSGVTTNDDIERATRAFVAARNVAYSNSKLG